MNSDELLRATARMNADARNVYGMMAAICAAIGGAAVLVGNSFGWLALGLAILFMLIAGDAERLRRKLEQARRQL